MKLSSSLAAGVLLTVAVPLCAQTLGDLAKREAERRRTAPPAAKTYTNEDLKKLPPMPDGGTKPAAKAATPDDAAKAGEPAKPGDAKADAAKKEADPAKGEKYWRARITAANDDLRRNEMFRDALQSRINALSADFAGRDDPFQRATIADNRQKALAELARVNEEIVKGNKLIADIAEEARQAGVPPGWIR
jgi:hypothetical protein